MSTIVTLLHNNFKVLASFKNLCYYFNMFLRKVFSAFAWKQHLVSNVGTGSGREEKVTSHFAGPVWRPLLEQSYRLSKQRTVPEDSLCSLCFYPLRFMLSAKRVTALIHVAWPLYVQSLVLKWFQVWTFWTAFPDGLNISQCRKKHRANSETGFPSDNTH